MVLLIMGISMQNIVIGIGLTLDLVALSMSFIYHRNKIDPATDPCGTPEVSST